MTLCRLFLLDFITFAVMKWIGKRISFVDDKNKTTIVIYPEGKVLWNALIGAWTAMWIMLGVIVLWAYFTFEISDQEAIIIVIFLSFWVYYAYKAIKSFLWFLWGKELIKIDEVSLIYKRSIKGYGKAIPYYFENIKKISVTVPKEKSIQSSWEKSPWVIGGERIEFDYKGKRIRFGRKLNEKDTALLFKLVTKRIEERLRKRKK